VCLFVETEVYPYKEENSRSMKTKLPKILSVALTVMLLASLMIGAAVTPAAAGTLSWSAVNVPSTTGNTLIAGGADLGPVALSPDFASDNTVFAAVNTAGAENVYKSTNGGYSWVSATSASPAVPIVALAVSPNYATDLTVVFATGANVYRSTNGGATFSQLGVVTLAGTEAITSLAISPNYDGVGVIAIGVAEVATPAVAVPANSVQLWGLGGTFIWTGYGVAALGDVTAIAFSPNYPIDSALLAVGTPAAGTQLHLKIGSNAWNALGGPATVNLAIKEKGNAATGIIYSSIALPSDYNAMEATLRRAYVSTASVGGVAGGDDVYRITNFGAGVDLGLNQQIVNIKYDGTKAEGVVVGGNYAAAAAATAQVYRCANPAAAGSWAWYGATNAPSGISTAAGTLAYVDIAADYATSKVVVAGTAGDDSAFAVSTDGAVDFNERGLIDNAAVAALATITGLALSPDYATDTTMFMVSDSSSASANDTSVWVSKNGGSTWDRCFTANFATAGTGVIALSPDYATDSTVYVGDQGALNMWYSADGGNKWSARTVANVGGIQSMAAADGSTLYVGDSASGSITKSTNSGWIWPTSMFKATGATVRVASIVVDGSTVVVGGGAGTVRRSTDGGTTWAKVGTTLTAANVFTDFDGDYVYAVEAGTGDAFRFQVGTSTTWYTVTVTPATGAGIALAGDGTLYVNDPAVTANNQVYRTLTPTWGPTPVAPTFEWVAGLGAASSDLNVVAGDTGNMVAIVYGAGIRIYSDVVSAGTGGPTLLGPADGYSCTSTDKFTVSVQNVTGVTNWQIACSNDKNFINGVDSTTRQPRPATQVAVDISADLAGVSNEKPVYWRARALAASPLVGPWSEIRVVYPQPQADVNAPVPQTPAGLTAVSVSVNPVFNWDAMKYASGYEFELSKNAGTTARGYFVEVVASATGDNALGVGQTSYASPVTLDYSTVYYWHVKATTANVKADWSRTIGFTTEAAPPAPEPPPPPPPPTPEPTTPAYIWAVIGIGAALCLAVVVLIVRTRRVV